MLLTCLVRTEPICLTFTLLIIIHLSSCQFFNINKIPWFTSKPALHLHASFPVNCNALKRNYKICREWLYNYLVNSPLFKFIRLDQDFFFFGSAKKNVDNDVLSHSLNQLDPVLNYVAFLCKIITLLMIGKKVSYIFIFHYEQPTTWSSWFNVKICSSLEIEEHKIKQ